jgi:hypothetical protein
MPLAGTIDSPPFRLHFVGDMEASWDGGKYGSQGKAHAAIKWGGWSGATEPRPAWSVRPWQSQELTGLPRPVCALRQNSCAARGCP